MVAEDVMEFVLEAEDGGPLPEWEPGAHLDLVLDEATVRQYSLSGDPADPGVYRIAVLREPDGRGGSRRVHDELHPGDTVLIRGPRNHFPLAACAAYVFVAGGIGITPLLPMIRRVAGSGASWQVHYAGRSLARMAYLDELAGLGAGPDAVHVAPSSEGARIDLDAVLGAAPTGASVYCCGPASLITAAEAAAHRYGLAYRAERFVPADRADTVDGPFGVRLATSGLDLDVPVGRSLLEVLLDAGIDVPSSCEEGTCGTCEVGVLDGVPDHRDSILTAQEQAAGDRMYVCVSRSCTARLVLDL
jgi:ferredoxin-NADP reductase